MNSSGYNFNWQSDSEETNKDVGLYEPNAQEIVRARRYQEIMRDYRLDVPGALSLIYPEPNNQEREYKMQCTLREATLLDEGYMELIDFPDFRKFLVSSTILYDEFHPAVSFFHLNEVNIFKRLMDLYASDGNTGVLKNVEVSIKRRAHANDRVKMMVEIPGIEGQVEMDAPQYEIDILNAGLKSHGLMGISEYRELVRAAYKDNWDEFQSSFPVQYDQFISYFWIDRDRYLATHRMSEEDLENFANLKATPEDIADRTKGMLEEQVKKGKLALDKILGLLKEWFK